MKIHLWVAAFALLGACAPTPESIAPAYVSELQYRPYSCEQLGEESDRLNQALATASTQQSKARENDTVGIILICLPVGSMSGQSIAPQIALYKGQLEAVHRASIRNSCPEMTRIQPAPPAVQPGIQSQPAPAPDKPVSYASGVGRLWVGSRA